MSTQAKLKPLLYPIIATMTIFQLTMQQNSLISLEFYQNLFNPTENSKLPVQTLLMQNGLFIFGCFIGTEIQKLLHKQTSKFIFLLSDLIYFFSNINWIFTQDQYYIFFICRIITGAAIGINYSQAIIYIKQITSKTRRDFFYLFIPIQLQLGFIFGNFLQQTLPNIGTSKYMLIMNSLPLIRMIVLLIIEIETPQYYYFVKKDIRQSKRMFQEIHADNIQTQQTIFQNYEKQQKQIDAGGLSLLSNKLIKKYYKCIALVVITQLSGYGVFLLYYQVFMQQGVEYSLLIGLVVITSLGFCRKIKKSLLILIGQLIISVGLAVFSFIFSNLGATIAICLVTFGYYLGLGTFIFQIIPILLPEKGITHCITAQWMIDLAQMCILGLFYNKAADVLEYKIKFIDIFKIYFYISCFNLVILFLLLRSPKKKSISQIPNLQENTIERAESYQ